MARGDRIFAKLASEYAELVARYLPRQKPGDSWAYCAQPAPMHVEGWKLHLPATLHSASAVLAAVGPFLTDEGIFFKGAADLATLKRMNTGIPAMSQVGKSFTVYLDAVRDCASVASHLQDLLKDLDGPPVPYEPSFAGAGRIFYRYGAYRGQWITGPRNGRVRDRRSPNTAVPHWLPNPLAAEGFGEDRPKAKTPLQYLTVIECLAQRGKGGVYRVLLPSGQSAILKEGRRNGETTPLGIDGATMVRREASNLRTAAFSQIGAPQLIGTFSVNSVQYALIEDVGDRVLSSELTQGSMNAAQRRACCHRMAQIVKDLHEAGFVWRDLKPANLVAGPSGIRPIDFEGAVRADNRRDEPWGSYGYLPPGWPRRRTSDQWQDGYALAVSIIQVLAPQTIRNIARLRAGGYHEYMVAACKRLPRHRISFLPDHAIEMVHDLLELRGEDPEDLIRELAVVFSASEGEGEYRAPTPLPVLDPR